MKLDDISVAHKLLGSTLLVLVAMFLVAALTQRSSNQALTDAMGQVQQIEVRINRATQWRGMIETNVQRLLALTVSPDPAIAQTFGDRFKNGIADITVLQRSIVESATTEAERAALDRVAASREVLIQLNKKAGEMRASGDPAAIPPFVAKELLPAVGNYIDSLGGFVKLEESLRDEANLAAQRTRDRSMALAMASVCAVFVACLGWTLLLIRSIRRPLERAVAVADAIAAGDLTASIDVHRRDEIGSLLRALDTMAQRLRTLVGEVRDGVESVSTASTQIASGNQDLSARTEHTASSLQQTASSMEQLTGTVAQSAQSARTASELSQAAAASAERGGAVVSEVMHSMREISDSSARIADIVGVIDSIAFQTNILALNAAVEAARAGEQGRGFAVVAGEVRNLARRCSEAAKEVKVLISASAERVEFGASRVGKAGEAMQEIVGNVRKVNALVGEIALATTEQHDGIGQVNLAVGHLDELTQQNAALVEESAAAASSLRDQALRLARTVSVFKVSELATSDAAHAEPLAT